jgi:DHA3 family macrolide efflux protein-like MFS transporter
MLMLKALREKAIARLWFGQALSSIGDEVYRVSLTWMMVGMVGADTGYLNAAQAGALMTLSFVGGRWADHWEPLATMVNVDALRGVIVLIPVLYSFFATPPLVLLVIVALTLSALGAFFDPALQSSLPRFSRDLPILRAATGLMMTTTRLARMVGPALIGFLAGILPAIHFFTVDAISFFLSALFVRSLVGHGKRAQRLPAPRVSFKEALLAGFRDVRRAKGMGFILFAKALTGGTWNLAYGLGFALLVQEVAQRDTRAFGSVMAAYGLGNFAGALYFGNRQRQRPGLLMSYGFIWLGVGFALIACCPTIGWIMIMAALTGFSGTMNEVTFSDLVQSRFQVNEITRVFRLRMACDTAVTLFFMLISPLLFKLLSVRVVIALCGLVWINTGLAGVFWNNKNLEEVALA